MKKKLIILGDSACGKTSLMLALSNKKFSEEYVPTYFDEEIVDKEVDGIKVTLHMHDTPGEKLVTGTSVLSKNDYM